MWKIYFIAIIAAVHCQSKDKNVKVQDARVGLTELVNEEFPPSSTAAPTTTCGPGFDCVAYYLCSNSSFIIKDGTGLIDIRGCFDGTQCECENYMEQCCAISEKTDVPIVTPKPTPMGCGFRNVDGVGFRITGSKDNETEFGEFPWMVAILTEEIALDQKLNIYKCGGSLVAPNVVLTGAHCVSTVPPNKLKVRAGEWDTQTKNEILHHQDRNVTEVVIHPHYYKGGLFNDVALLFLDGAFEQADHIKPVCLPPANYNFDHERCFTTGWGKDTFGQAGNYQVILKKIDLPIVPHDLCQTQLRATRLGKHFELHPSFVCAGGELGKDACRGDGGSPLVCPIPNAPNRYYQAGIVAWGIGCGDANVPGVYASVANLQPWIEEQLQYKAINPAFYTP